MTTTDDSKINSFIAPESNAVAGFSLRPFTAQSLLFLQKTGSGFLGQIDSNDPDLFFHIASFLYIHTAPVEDIKKAITDMAVYRDKVIDFSAKISVSEMIKSAESIKKIIEDSMVGQNYQIDSENDDSPN
jgi:hypothetical protein